MQSRVHVMHGTSATLFAAHQVWAAPIVGRYMPDDFAAQPAFAALPCTETYSIIKHDNEGSVEAVRPQLPGLQGPLQR